MLTSSGYGDCQPYLCSFSLLFGRIHLLWVWSSKEHVAPVFWLVYLFFCYCCRWTIVFLHRYHYYRSYTLEVFKNTKPIRNLANSTLNALNFSSLTWEKLYHYRLRELSKIVTWSKIKIYLNTMFANHEFRDNGSTLNMKIDL